VNLGNGRDVNNVWGSSMSDPAVRSDPRDHPVDPQLQCGQDERVEQNLPQPALPVRARDRHLHLGGSARRSDDEAGNPHSVATVVAECRPGGGIAVGDRSNRGTPAICQHDVE
jgi:hypothetical protein